MRLYAVTMFVHILGVIALFGGFVLWHRVGAQLRRATRYDEARPWGALLFAARPMMPSGVVMLLLSGGYLAYRLGARGVNPPAWILVAAAAVLFVGAVALAVAGPYAGAVHRSLAAGEGAIDGEASRAIARRDVVPWVASANGAALGTLWLMTARPGLTESALVVAVAAAGGAAIGWRVARGGPSGR